MLVERLRCIASLAVAALVTSCAVGPDFKVPNPPDVEGYTKEPLSVRTSSTDVALGGAQRFAVAEDIPERWWELFRSPALNALIEKSLQANPDLQSQIAALRSAQELVYAQQGHFFPTAQANFNPMRQKVANSLSSPLNSGDTIFNLFTAQLLVSYTLDVWGGTRRAVESQQALADAQRFQVEAAYITLTSNIAVAAIQEASLRAQIDATRQLISINTKLLDISRQQLSSGYSTASDVAAQEAALAQVKATLPPLRKQLAVQRDLLAALAGRFPSQETDETFRLASFRLPTELPVSLPSTLIEQRPDVRAAEENLHSAGALVGVAIANILPSFTINGNGGYTSTRLSHLITTPNQFWNVAGNATHTIFDGFTLLHQERAAQATYEQAAWTYRNTVIGAVQNVADTLRALQNDADALKAAREFQRAARKSYELARQQTEAGNANVLLLLNAQQAYLQAVIQVIQAQSNRLSDTAALFQALGGGWWNRNGPPAPEQKFDFVTGESIDVGSQ